MIDLHAHILPGIDDGPEEIEESIKMCRLAYKDGIRIIVATPHLHPGLYHPSKEIILSKVAELNQVLENYDFPKVGRNLDLKILPGADINLSFFFHHNFSAEEIIFINDNNKYLLLELPDYFLYEPVKKFIASFRDRGFIPIISHPERNAFLQKNIPILAEFIKLGALSQITALSINGYFGKAAKEAAGTFLQYNLAHLLASDAHSSRTRPPLLTKALAQVCKIVGEERARRMVYDLPLAVIEGREIEIPAPEY